MQLAHCSWQEVEDYLSTHQGILVPIGSTEQHGPNGLIGTDALCAEPIARRVGEELAAAAVNDVVEDYRQFLDSP